MRSNAMIRPSSLRVAILSASALTLAACAHGTPPPEISLDEPVATPAVST